MAGRVKAKWIFPPSTPAGGLYAWGYNANFGPLGDGTLVAKSSPVPIGADTDWADIGGGEMHTVGIRSGKLFTWGYNASGQLGDGTTNSRSSPVQVGSETDWTIVKKSFGSQFSCAIRGGRLFTWGSNVNGQLGDDSTSNKSSPVPVGAGTDWTAISSGSYHTLGLRGGKLYAWGLNGNGQLGLGDRTDRSSPVQVGSETDWTYIGTGHASSFGIRGGKLFSWGLNGNGQLGLEDIADRSSPVQVGAATDWTIIAHEAAYNCMAIRNGALFAWGENFYGQLGLEDKVYRSSPVQVGAQTDWTMAAIGTEVSVGLRSGSYYVIGGLNEVGQFGDGNVNNYRSSPVQLGSETNWLIAHIKFKSVFGIR